MTLRWCSALSLGVVLFSVHSKNRSCVSMSQRTMLYFIISCLFENYNRYYYIEGPLSFTRYTGEFFFLLNLTFFSTKKLLIFKGENIYPNGWGSFFRNLLKICQVVTQNLELTLSIVILIYEICRILANCVYCCLWND